MLLELCYYFKVESNDKSLHSKNDSERNSAFYYTL